jgi:putative MATE family efflux protein
MKRFRISTPILKQSSFYEEIIMKLIRKDIFKLTIPILAEQAFMTLMGMVNTIMAGYIGKEAVSAVGMVDSLNNIFIAFFSALAVGGTVVVAQYSGKGNVKKANDATKQALYSGVLLALLVTIITWVFKEPLIKVLYGTAEKSVINAVYIYLGISLLTYPLISILLVSNGVLRGVGDTKTPMKITIAMNIVNVIFSYIFIYGIHINNGAIKINTSGMGVSGAALGIAIARIFGSVVVLAVLLRGSKTLKLRKLKSFKFDKEILKPIIGIGVPSSVESLLFNGGKLITQIYIVSMGTIAIASNSIGGSISGILNVPGIAFSIAATTVVGQHMGKGETEEAGDSLLYLTLFSSLCLLILGLISIPAAGAIAALYSNNSDIVSLTTKLVRINGFWIVAWPFSFVLPAGLKGAGDAKYTMITAIIGMWIFRIVLGYVLGITFNMGLIGVWLGMYTDWVVRGTLYYIRLKRGKWKKKAII